jgi:hypothetical protein
MISAMASHQEKTPSAQVRDLFVRAFGSGVSIGDAPRFSPEYDGITPLDIHALLTLTYLEGFEPVEASMRRPRATYSVALPNQAADMGRRLTRFLDAYAQAVPPAALALSFVALVNLELFVYTLKLFYATAALVRERELPPAMLGGDHSEPDLYCDFSTARGGLSESLARICVERDLESLSAFSAALIRLRTIEKLARRTKSIADQLDGLGPDTPRYLLDVCLLDAHQRVRDYAEIEYEAIREETVRVHGEDSRAAVHAQFEAARGGPATEVDRVTQLLASEQRRHVYHLSAWYQSAGGLKAPYGVLAGAPKARTSWRYAISDDLLATLVLLAHADEAAIRDDGGRISLREFLSYLERSYGIIIDRPPSFADDTSSRAAARDNLAGMKRQLREMDLFAELSDDFTAQYLTVPVEARR